MDGFKKRLKSSCCFLPRLIFWYLGISTNANERLIYNLYSSFVLCMVSTYPVNNLFVLLQNLDNFDVATNSLFNLFGGLAALLKILVILYNKKRLIPILTQIETIQNQRNVSKGGQATAYNINKLTLACIGFLFMALTYFSIATITTRILSDDPNHWDLPISDVSFINRTYSPNYEVAWTYQVITVTILAMAFCLSDFLVASVIVDICIQLKILTGLIKTAISDLTKQDQLGHNRLHEQQNVIAIIVTEHLAIIDLANRIEKIFSLLAFLDVFGNLTMICFAVYYASVLPLFNFKALQVYLEVFCITISLFFICYWGSEISLAGQAVGHVCYHPEIVGTDVKFQRSLMLISLRSQKAITISVGKFTTLSIGVFVWIIKNSYSCFMILRRSNESRAK